MMNSAFINNSPDKLERVYAMGRQERVGQVTNLHPGIITKEDIEQGAIDLRSIDVIFSTWGMPALAEELIRDRLPNLKAVFYAAGSVKGFAEPFMDRGVRVFSAASANARFVAEFTLSQILLSNKGYYRNIRAAKQPIHHGAYRGQGNFGATVALIGGGMIARHLIGLLKPFSLQILIYDPYISAEQCSSMGAEKVSLEEAFARGDVVSNHAPNIPETKKMLNGALFALMKDDAVFINTGRGATVAEDELIAELKRRPTLTALLDVTEKEPPAPDSEFYTLDNVVRTTHIAGAIGKEVVAMADLMIEEFLAWESGQPVCTEVLKSMLPTMA